MAIEDSSADLPAFLGRHAIDDDHFAPNAVLLYVPTGTGAHRQDQIARFLAANASSLTLLDHHASAKSINKQCTASAVIEEKGSHLCFRSLERNGAKEEPHSGDLSTRRGGRVAPAQRGHQRQKGNLSHCTILPFPLRKSLVLIKGRSRGPTLCKMRRASTRSPLVTSTGTAPLYWRSLMSCPKLSLEVVCA